MICVFKMVYKLLKLIGSTGYDIIQKNGQRSFGPPKDWTGPPPPKGCEVFIGKLPRAVFEDELVPLFSRVGKIYELRVMLNFSRLNRGFAFLNYTSRADATAAIRELHNYEIRPGHHIAVVRSVDNCRLYLGGIPKNKTKEEVQEELSKHVSGIVDIILYKNCFDRRFNRGFAFVEFVNHREAAMARRALTQGSIQLWGQGVMVDWAEPEPEIDEEVLKQVKILYIRNLSITTPQEVIRDMFENKTGYAIEHVKKIYDYAFVHFHTRAQAEFAKDKLNNAEIDGLKIEIKWAKPVDRKLYKVQKLLKGNSKFNSSTKSFNKALFLYQSQINENMSDNFSPDEGIESAVVSDSYSGSPNNLVIQQSSDIIHHEEPSQYPITELEELCKRYNLPSPKYQFQKAEGSWICQIEFRYMEQVPGVPGLQIISSSCLTTEEAQLDAVSRSLTYIKTCEQNGIYGSPYAPQMYQPNILQTMAMAPPPVAVPHWHPGLYPAVTTQLW